MLMAFIEPISIPSQTISVHILIGESHAAVDDDHISAVFQNGDILADLIQTA